MAIHFKVENEYIDQVLGRRVLVGEVLAITADRATKIKSLGVQLTPIREQPPDTAATEPTTEKAVNPNGRTRRAKV